MMANTPENIAMKTQAIGAISGFLTDFLDVIFDTSVSGSCSFRGDMEKRVNIDPGRNNKTLGLRLKGTRKLSELTYEKERMWLFPETIHYFTVVG